MDPLDVAADEGLDGRVGPELRAAGLPLLVGAVPRREQLDAERELLGQVAEVFGPVAVRGRRLGAPWG